MANIRGREVAAFLRYPPQPIRLFLLHGNDQGLVAERAARLLDHARESLNEIDVTRLDSDALAAEPGRASDVMRATSLFGGEAVLRVRYTDARQNLLPALKPLIEEPPTGLCIVEAGELRATNPLRKAFEGANTAAAVGCYAEEGGAYEMARSLLEAEGIAVEPEAADALRRTLGGDVLVARREAEKLLTYLGDERTLTAEQVSGLAGDVAAPARDAAIDAAFAGDAATLERELQRLTLAGESLQGLGTQALRHGHLLRAMRAEIDRGRGVDQAIGAARPPVFFNRKAAVAKALRAGGEARLARACAALQRAVLGARKHPNLEEALLAQAFHAIARSAAPKR